MKPHSAAARTVLILLIALGALWVAAACTPTSVEKKEPFSDLVWPEPPEKSRIRLDNIVLGPEDLHIKASAFKKFMAYFAGQPGPQMVKPYGVEADRNGTLYVVDTALKQINVFDTAGNAYYTFPAKANALVSPIDIAIDDDRGLIYVSDSEQKLVQIYKEGGKVFAGEIGRGVMERPTGLAVNKATSELLVVDTLSANILRYDLGDRRLKGLFGGSGNRAGELHYPTNICVAPTGNILVSDSLNFRVQVFSAQGEFLHMFGGEGDSPGYFTRPRGVAVDSDGNIYVVDALFDNVQLFDSQGRLLMVFGSHGSGYGEFWLPTGIFIDAGDRIYVADSYNRRIQIFKYLK